MQDFTLIYVQLLPNEIQISPVIRRSPPPLCLHEIIADEEEYISELSLNEDEKLDIIEQK